MPTRSPSLARFALRAALVALAAFGAGGFAAAPAEAHPSGSMPTDGLGAAQYHSVFERVEARRGPDEPPVVATPRADCGPGAWEETGIQGRVSRQDHVDGLAARGFRCNAELVGSFTKEPPNLGTVGGYKVHRYVDDAGNECAYYDTSLLPPTNAPDLTFGVRVLDMSDPTDPQLSTILTTPAMAFPHESLSLNEKRGLLGAVSGNLSQAVLPGIVDIYDISGNCLQPVLKASTPLGVYGHEGAFAPDGKTFYSASFSTGTIVALDVSNLNAPVPVWFGRYDSHGLSLSDDGTRAYIAKDSNFGNFGLITLDTTQVQDRVVNPQVPQVSFLDWESMSIPQSTAPITIDGKPFVVETDEFGAQEETGGARLIDISDEKNPKVTSLMRLEVMQPENFAAQAGDPGVDTPFQFAQGYTGHFCTTPTRVDPPIVACGMSVSGLRVFNIEDPYNPREVAYYNAPVAERAITPEGSNWAYSAPTFAPGRKEIWYADAYNGFFSVRLTNDAWPDAKPAPTAKCGNQTARLLRGTARGERLEGTKGTDKIAARQGDDRVTGRGGADCLRGGAGEDDLKGGRGNDRVRGGSGKDFIRGGAGKDRLTGAKGDDIIHGAKGNDVLRGGRGDDVLDGGLGSNRFFCGRGNDVAIARHDDRVHRSCEEVR